MVLQQHSQRCSDVTLSSLDRGCLQQSDSKTFTEEKNRGEAFPQVP